MSLFILHSHFIISRPPAIVSIFRLMLLLLLFELLLSQAFHVLYSAATLPVTMKCLEEKQNVDKRIVRFMVPIGATVNMDGGALYEALACIYLAQAYNYDLDFGKYIAIR